MPQCFGGVTHYIPPEQEAEYEHAINHFAAGYASDTYFQGEIEQGSIIPADSIEELAKAVNIPADALVETVERYNELAHAGKDADFSKVSTRLFPVENPPYYAVPFGDSGMLVLIGGIDCDVDCRALDAEKNPVPGLFVAGEHHGRPLPGGLSRDGGRRQPLDGHVVRSPGRSQGGRRQVARSPAARIARAAGCPGGVAARHPRAAALREASCTVPPKAARLPPRAALVLPRRYCGSAA